MDYSKEEITRIGNNIAFLREKIFKCKNQNTFFEFLNKPKGLKPDTIRQIEQKRYTSLSKEKVEYLAGLLFPFSYQQIVYQDLSLLSEEYIGWYTKIINDSDGIYSYAETVIVVLETLFPFVTNEEATTNEKESTIFNNQLAKFDDGIAVFAYEAKEILETLKTLDDSYRKDKSPKTALNYLSLLGRYLFKILGFDSKTVSKYIDDKFDNYLDFSSSFYNEINSSYDKKTIIENFKKDYAEKIIYFLKELREERTYEDYVYYYLALMYIFGVYFDDEIRFTEVEYTSFGSSLMKQLILIGNKYAKSLEDLKI